MIFLNNASGRYAVIAQLVALYALLAAPFEAHAANSFIRGGNSNNRRLQDVDCSSISKNNQCPTDGPQPACLWIQGSCVPAPTPSPSAKPTSSPTTNAPTRKGSGYCSDDSARSCYLSSECACGGSAPAEASSSSSSLFRQRKLQGTACSDFTKNNECPREDGCDWIQGDCVLVSTSSQPTGAPTKQPTDAPSTTPPTKAPTPCACIGVNLEPTTSPTKSPTKFPTKVPTDEPTASPSRTPTDEPTEAPTKEPTEEPTASPTKRPTDEPSKAPTKKPTDAPSSAPSKQPVITDSPTNSPSKSPTKTTDSPTKGPTYAPTKKPTSSPTDEPTIKPTLAPTEAPTSSALVLTEVGDNGSPIEAFPLGECEGDCDSDSECEGLLQCFQRAGTEPVPGCSGSGTSGRDYCAKRPTENTLFMKGDEELPAINFPLGLCEGDCDNDGECQAGLTCQQRSGNEDVPGCIGTAVSGEDYCRYPSLVLTGDNGSPIEAFPLGNCEGDCDSDGDCAGALKCYQRSGTEPVTGCVGEGVSAKDYCYDPNTPTPSPVAPTNKPTYAPNTFGATYVPGDLSVPCDNGKLTLSKGMSCELLTTAGQQVLFADGTLSSETMHERADGAGVIPHPTDGGWYYVSNSETKTGGVGTLRFNTNGELVGYERTLTGTIDNCGGGRTPWNTWVSCEEDGSAGYCWEVDPYTGYTKRVKNVPQGGNYESFAYDNQDPTAPNNMRFFTTEDSSNGALVRYTPHPDAFVGSNSSSILNTDNGDYDYLVLDTSDGTFSWSPNLVDGEASASALFPSSEGIDVHGRILSFVAKTRKELFTLDLAAGTWTKSSTVSGAFNLQPDQLARIIGDSDTLYFCEDGGSDCDIHGRDATGQYFTVVRGDGYSTETTGLAFSPNNMFMYVAFQGNSNIYKFWRDDGFPFNGVLAHTKYH